MDFCPMCYSEASISNSSLNKHKKVNCPVCGEYYYSPPIFDDQKLVICAYIYNAIKNNDVIPIFSDTINQSEINDARIETVTPEILLNYFPKNLHDLINKILLNIAFYIKNIGSKITNIYLTNANDRQYAKKTALLKTLFCVYENNLDQINILLKHLEKDGYIEPIGLGVFSLTLSFKGWLRVEELQRQNAAVNQAFIIISNKELMNEAKESIIKVLSDLKIAAKLWDETKYKKPVTSEIFYEIKRSKLCIIDLTYQKSPAYFEAGYAEALKKPIIYTCKKDFYLKKQFDIIHNNMINWQTPEELYQALHTRISAVIGL